MLLHFSVRRFLCAPGQSYFITDFSKGAILVENAGNDRVERVDRWYTLLKEEVDLVAKPNARIIAVGQVVAKHLKRCKFPRQVTSVLHYSPLAAPRSHQAHTLRWKGSRRSFPRLREPGLPTSSRPPATCSANRASPPRFTMTPYPT